MSYEDLCPRAQSVFDEQYAYARRGGYGDESAREYAVDAAEDFQRQVAEENEG